MWLFVYVYFFNIYFILFFLGGGVLILYAVAFYI